MPARPWIIPKAAHDALNNTAVYRGPRVTLTAQLGPDAWVAVKATLERTGAVYVVGSSAFEYEPDQDARAIVTAALAAGKVMAAKGADGYVSTPADLAEYIVNQYACIDSMRGRRLRVLEPSAGIGRLVSAIMRGGERDAQRCKDIAGWMHVTAVEMDARRARQIPSSAAVSVVRDRFEAWALRQVGGRFDRVVMNPPFSVPGDARIWAKHLRTAWELLAPGGRLVAILPARAVTDGYTGTGTLAEVRDLVRIHGGYELLDADEFAESGVTYPTCVVWLDRPPVEAPPVAPVVAGLPAWVARPYLGTETPVPVTRPFLTRGAAATMPVQTWYDGWRKADRVLRYRGECCLCARPVWAFDDGENDPRGALGEAAPDLLDPAEMGGDAPEALPVVACFLCRNDGYETYAKAERFARDYWTRIAAEREPAPEMSRADLHAEMAAVLVADVIDQRCAAAAAEAGAPYVSGWRTGVQLSLLDD